MLLIEHSVITKDTQWTISEGTKTLNLADTTKAANEGDHLWIGCGSLVKEESLCQVSLIHRTPCILLIPKCAVYGQPTCSAGRYEPVLHRT